MTLYRCPECLPCSVDGCPGIGACMDHPSEGLCEHDQVRCEDHPCEDCCEEETRRRRRREALGATPGYCRALDPGRRYMCDRPAGHDGAHDGFELPTVTLDEGAW